MNNETVGNYSLKVTLTDTMGGAFSYQILFCLFYNET